MIFSFLIAFYNFCKKTISYLVHGLVTLTRIIFDTIYLSTKFVLKTAIEGSVQLLKIVFYYPIKLIASVLYKIPGIRHLIAAYIYVSHAIVKTSTEGIAHLLRLLFSGVFSLLKHLSVGSLNITRTLYYFTLRAPLKILSILTTFIAKTIARLIRHTKHIAYVLKTALHHGTVDFLQSLFALIFNFGKALINVPLAFLQKIFAALSSFAQMTFQALSSGINLLSRSIRYLLEIMHLIAIATPMRATHAAATKIRNAAHHTHAAAAKGSRHAKNIFSTILQKTGSLLTILSNALVSAMHHFLRILHIATIQTPVRAARFTVDKARATHASLAHHTHKALQKGSHHTKNLFLAIVQKTRSLFIELSNSVVATVRHLLHILHLVTIQAPVRAAQFTANKAKAAATKTHGVLTHGTTQSITHLKNAHLKIKETTTSLLASAGAFSKKITDFLIGLVQALGAVVISAKNSATSFLYQSKEAASNFINSLLSSTRSTMGNLKERSSTFAGNAKNKGALIFEKGRSQFSLMRAASQTALAGTAGFVFISIPRHIVSGAQRTISTIITYFSYAFVIIKSSFMNAYSFCTNGVNTLLKHLFSSITTTLSYTGSLLTRGMQAVSSGINTVAQLCSEALLQTWRSTYSYGQALFSYLKQGLSFVESFFTSAKTLSAIVVEKGAQRALSTPQAVASHSVSLGKTIISLWSSLLNGLNTFFTSIFNALLATFASIIRGLSAGLRMSKELTVALTSNIFDSLLSIKNLIIKSFSFLAGGAKQVLLTTASAGKTGCIVVGKSSVCAARGAWWGLQTTMYGFGYVLNKLKDSFSFFCYRLYNATVLVIETLIALVKNIILLPFRALVLGKQYTVNTFNTSTPIAASTKVGIQQYALFGSLLYCLLVLVTTYITPPSNQGSHNPAYTAQNQASHNALPVQASFELQSISLAKGTFGTATIKGILTYSYEAGLESARNIDNITIEKALKFNLKKLGSSMNHYHVVTTRFLLTATLGIAASSSPAFPFAPTESAFVIKNNALTTQDMYYQPIASSFGTEFEMPITTKINLKQNAATTTSTKSPKLTITLEHSGVPAYALLILYVLILGFVFMALTALGSLLPQSVRLSASCIASAGLSILWVLSHFFGLLPTINHLFLTLLMCLALSLVSVGFNASLLTSPQLSSENGKTRWTLGLLALLALFLTLLIKL